MIDLIKKILLLFFLISGTLFSVSAKKIPQNPNLIKGKLSNGLTYYIYPNDYPKGEAIYRLFIKSGSVFETEDQKGLAHFLEHMAFNGTTHFPGNSMIRFLESHGAKFGKDLNAHTSMNETVYKLQLPSSDRQMVDSTITILADWAGHLLLDSLEIEKERGVILSEWLSRTGPESEIGEAFLMEILNGSRYSKRKTIGDTAVIRHFKHEEIKNYYRDWYAPRLMAVAVAGDVDSEYVKNLIVEKFGSLKNGSVKEIPSYAIDDYDSVSVKRVAHPSLKKEELNIIRLLPMPDPVQTEKDYKNYLQRAMLNRLTKARYNALTFDDVPFNGASLSHSSFLNIKGGLFASVELIPGKIEAGITEFARETERMVRYGFSKKEIDKEKKRLLNTLRRRAESKNPEQSSSFIEEMYQNFYIGHQMFTPAEEYRMARKFIAQIDSSMLVKQLQKLERSALPHYLITSSEKNKDEFPDDRKLLSIFEQVKKETLAPYVLQFEVPDQLLPEKPEGGKIVGRRSIDEIDAQELILSNGVKVIFKNNSLDKDRIVVSGFRKGGLYALDSTRYVSGIFSGSVIPLSGAGEFSRDALSYFLSGKDVSCRFLVEKHRSGVIATSKIDQMETMFQLLFLRWTQPKVDMDLLRQVMDKSIEKYRTIRKTDADLFNTELRNILRTPDYTDREISDTIIENEVKAEWLLPAYNHCFGAAEGYTFIITSDQPLQDIEPFIETYLGGLPGGKSCTEYVHKGGKIPVESVVFSRKAGDSPKAVVSLIFQQDSIDGSIMDLNLKNDVAKGILRMKLLAVLREKMGMVYSVGVSVGATQHPSALCRETISFSCLPDNVQALVDSTFLVIGNMCDDPDSFSGELEDVKTNLIKDWKITKQRSSFWTTQIRNTLYNNIPDWKHITDYEARVKNITSEDVADHIRKCFLKTPVVKAVLLPKDDKE